jgi:hypothetical protein
MHFVQAKFYFEQTKMFRDARRCSENLKLVNYNLTTKLANKEVSEGKKELAAKCSMVRNNLSDAILMLLLF